MKAYSAAAVEKQLGRIIASKEFANGAKLGQFLSYVVGQMLVGTPEKIKQYTIATEALGYGEHFDPMSNPTVRILAGRLRRALDRYYQDQGTADPIRIEIPKGSYAPIFSGSAEESRGAAKHYSDVSTESAGASPEPSVAVIGFQSLGKDNSSDHIASGLTQEIIIALGRFSKFRVKGPLDRSIVTQDCADPTEIGRRHQTRFVLDGAVRANEASFRLTASLIDSASGEQVWGEVLDSKPRNGAMPDLDDQIVSKVAATIAENHGVVPGILLSELKGRPRENSSSYSAILRFYHYLRVFTHESYTEALSALEQAARDDGCDATVNAMLSDLIATGWMYGMTDDQSAVDRAERLARIAVSREPANQPARFAMALAAFLRCNRALFLEEADRALQINQNNALYVAAVAAHITMVGELDRGRELINHAMDLNPHHANWYHFVPFMNAYLSGDYHRALSSAYSFNTPEFFWDPLIRAATLGKLGRLPEASSAADQLLAIEPNFRMKGRNLMRRLAYQEETVELLAAGLQKAGLELE